MSVFAVWTTVVAVASGMSALCAFAALVLRTWKRAAERRDKPILDAIAAVSRKVDENARGRLRQEIFRYGNLARRGMHISGEEFRYLQECYAKYTALGGNGIAHDEYELVRIYYDKGGKRE